MSLKLRFTAFCVALFAPISAVFGQEPSAVEQNKPMLSILALTNTLNSQLVDEFERQSNTRVRVDFADPRTGLEARLRSTPRAWHIVFADERHLRSLALARLLKPAPAGRFDLPVKAPLEKRSRLNDEGRLYFPTMADPLGLIWVSNTRKSPLPSSWEWLSDTNLNPLWRGRVMFPAHPHFQFMIALKAASFSPADLGFRDPPDKAYAWLKVVRSHSGHSNKSLLTKLVSRESVAGVAWYSEFLALKKAMPQLEFGIPREGTYFERYGAAFIADAGLEDVALNFLQFTLQKRDEFASAASLVPLSASKFLDSETSSWNLVEDEIPFPKSVEAELKKVVGVKQ